MGMSGVKMFMLMEYGGERKEEVLLMEDQRGWRYGVGVFRWILVTVVTLVNFCSVQGFDPK
jgi:hypothetical protein